MIGTSAGQNNITGDFNIFIGESAGINETGYNKLHIGPAFGNRPHYHPSLIYGEFDNNLLRVNGTLHISETAKLEPLAAAPTCATGDMGTLYADTGGALYFCNGTAWKTVQLN